MFVYNFFLRKLHLKESWLDAREVCGGLVNNASRHPVYSAPTYSDRVGKAGEVRIGGDGDEDGADESENVS